MGHFNDTYVAPSYDKMRGYLLRVPALLEELAEAEAANQETPESVRILEELANATHRAAQLPTRVGGYEARKVELKAQFPGGELPSSAQEELAKLRKEQRTARGDVREELARLRKKERKNKSSEFAALRLELKNIEQHTEPLLAQVLFDLIEDETSRDDDLWDMAEDVLSLYQQLHTDWVPKRRRQPLTPVPADTEPPRLP